VNERGSSRNVCEHHLFLEKEAMLLSFSFATRVGYFCWQAMDQTSNKRADDATRGRGRDI
jgi:hypothetical protein